MARPPSRSSTASRPANAAIPLRTEAFPLRTEARFAGTRRPRHYARRAQTARPPSRSSTASRPASAAERDPHERCATARGRRARRPPPVRPSWLRARARRDRGDAPGRRRKRRPHVPDRRRGTADVRTGAGGHRLRRVPERLRLGRRLGDVRVLPLSKTLFVSLMQYPFQVKVVETRCRHMAILVRRRFASCHPARRRPR